MTLRVALVWGLALAGACGGGVEPEIVPGGGVADPGIDGDLSIFVIDEDSDQPIEGARVLVADLEGETDAEGLFIASDLSGPQTIHVLADGYVSTTWVGVDSANVTIPLARPATDTDVAQGTVGGTIEGWADFDPPAGRLSVAIVGYSANHDDDDPANEIEQPDSMPAPNTCVNAGEPEASCGWTLRTRTGRMLIYAFLGNMDTQENLLITDFAYQSGVEVSAGGVVEDISLTIADRADLITPDVSLPSAPAGTDTVAAAVRMDLGDDGRLLLPVGGPLVVPVPSADLFPGATYELLGFAIDSSGGAASSIRIDRDIDPADAALGVMLPIPAGLATDGTSFEAEPVEDAVIHLFGVGEVANGATAWAVAVFDGTTEIQRPEAVTLPDGELTFAVQAVDADIDPREFAIDDVEQLVRRVSADAVRFTN